MKQVNRLSDKDVLFFYNLICEIEDKVSFKKGNIDKWIDENGLNIKHVYEINEAEEIGENTILYLPVIAETAKKKIQKNKKNKNNPKTPSASTTMFLHHIRNAFCHLNIELKDDLCVIKDYDKYHETNKKPTLTMYGKINKELFYGLITEILNENK